MSVLRILRTDIHAVFARDPAARSVLEVVLCYPGVHAVWAHRVTHWLWRHRLKLLARWLSQLARGLTGIEIHPGATIGSGFFIDHGMGVVIGETAEVGRDVTLYHGVTLGGTSMAKGKRHPTLRDGVVVGAGAKILGAIEIGAYSRIGANAVVVKPVPANTVVAGVPGRVVERHQPRDPEIPDLEHGQLPDIVGARLNALLVRVASLEEEVAWHHGVHHPIVSAEGQASGGNGHGGDGNGNGGGERSLVWAPGPPTWRDDGEPSI